MTKEQLGLLFAELTLQIKRLDKAKQELVQKQIATLNELEKVCQDDTNKKT